MMNSQKVVTPVETGVQTIYNYLKRLDSGACPGPRSGVRRNDEKPHFQTFYEFIIYNDLVKNHQISFSVIPTCAGMTCSYGASPVNLHFSVPIAVLTKR